MQVNDQSPHAPWRRWGELSVQASASSAHPEVSFAAIRLGAIGYARPAVSSRTQSRYARDPSATSKTTISGTS